MAISPWEARLSEDELRLISSLERRIDNALRKEEISHEARFCLNLDGKKESVPTMGSEAYHELKRRYEARGWAEFNYSEEGAHCYFVLKKAF